MFNYTDKRRSDKGFISAKIRQISRITKSTRKFLNLQHTVNPVLKATLNKRKKIRPIKGEHSVILSTFIKLQFVIKTFVLSILSGRFTQV